MHFKSQANKTIQMHFVTFVRMFSRYTIYIVNIRLPRILNLYRFQRWQKLVPTLNFTRKFFPWTLTKVCWIRKPILTVLLWNSKFPAQILGAGHAQQLISLHKSLEISSWVRPAPKILAWIPPIYFLP